MTLKIPSFMLSFLIAVLIVCAGCDAMSSLEDVRPFRARTTTQPNTLGDVVLSTNLDSNGCAADSETTFDDNDAVYIVLDASDFAEGTRFFARLYKDNIGLEDTEELVADQDYNNTCVNFVFEPSRSADAWDAGNYEIEFYINGNAHQAIAFEVR